MTPEKAVKILDTAARNGMAFLDAKFKDYFPRLAERTMRGALDLADCYTCALAIAAETTYYQATQSFPELELTSDRCELGFEASLVNDVTETQQYQACKVLDELLPPEKRMGALTRAWEWVIMERLAAEPQKGKRTR